MPYLKFLDSWQTGWSLNSKKCSSSHLFQLHFISGNNNGDFRHLKKYQNFKDINNSKRFLRGGTLGEAFQFEEDAFQVCFSLCFCCTSYLVLDGFDRYYQASVHFPIISAVNKSEQNQNNFLGLPRIKPRATGLEARILLLLWYSALPKLRELSELSQKMILDLR